MPGHRFIVSLLLLGWCACTTSRAADKPEGIGPEFSPRLGHQHTVMISDHEAARKQCEERLRQVLEEPALPGAPDFETQRLSILTAAKGLPMLLVDTPGHDETTVSVAVQSFRKLLAETQYPWDVLGRLLPHFLNFPKDGRESLLRDGYLYTSNPDLAHAIVNLVNAEHLFGHDKIWVKRGEELYHAVRKRGRYYFTDGPMQGERVRLVLLDRVGAGPVPQETLLRDIRSLKYRLQFNRAKIRHISAHHLVANLRYGNISVPTVLRSEGTKLSVECEVLSGSLSLEVDEIRKRAARRQRVVQALRQTMLLQIDEQLPFDEPRREFGFQLDGKLRANWRHAYTHNRNSYAFNGDRYRVFDGQGRPLVPQVCVDFLTDTFERTSGTWWRPKGGSRGRDIGALDFNRMDVLTRAKLRRIPGFLAHARENPLDFEIRDVPKGERVPLGERARFLNYLLENRDELQPGDMVMIRGEVPWDATELHSHSFFIYESDPISGIPIAIVGNAGRPSVRNWEVEARRTPRREIWHRVRPTTEWLESIIPKDAEISGAPLPISPRGNAGPGG